MTTGTEMVSRFVDSSVNECSASDQSKLHQSLFEFINIPEDQLVDTVLHDSPTV